MVVPQVTWSAMEHFSFKITPSGSFLGYSIRRLKIGRIKDIPSPLHISGRSRDN